MKWRAYPQYKDSGIEWLGKIPGHWEALHLGYAFRLQGGYAFKSVDFIADGVPIVRMSNLKEGKLDLTDAANIPEDKCLPGFSLESGDLLIGMSGSIENYAIVKKRDLPCQLNQRVGRFRPSNIKRTDYPYLQFLVSSRVFRDQVNLLAAGTAQANISSEEIEHFWIALPSFHEQRAIAAFLDRETERLDALVAGKERQIELLQEKRAALISRTVTKGLDPNAPMKDSGVEWLGEIPEGWSVTPLKRGLARNDGGVWGEDFDDDGTIVLRSTEIALDGSWRIEEPARRRLTTRERTDARLEVGDLLVTKSSGSALHLGKTAVVTEDVAAMNCCYSNFMQRLRVNKRLHPRYLFWILNGPVGRDQLVFLGTTTTGLANLGAEIIGGVQVPFLPLPEQRAIAAFLDRETERLDALVKKVQESITTLREHRTALISAAVTGKIQVQRTSEVRCT